MKKAISAILCIVLLLALAGCAAKTQDSGYTPISGLDANKKVTLKIAIPYETNKALNTVANAFMSKYKNVSVQLEYIEDYDTNAMKLFKSGELDFILLKDTSFAEYTEKDEKTGETVPSGRTTDDYFYNFAADKDIDFSDTAAEITNNYRHIRTDKSGNEIEYQYSYPLGGETRGVFVNVSLLKQYGLSVPTNYEELLACCKTLKDNGIIPIHGSSDTAAYGLAFANAVNPIVHDEAKLEKMKNAEAGISEEFKPVLEKLYCLATNRYFDYKAVEATLGLYKLSGDMPQAQSFLGLTTNAETFEVVKPENNIGYSAFFPHYSSTGALIQSLIEKYKLGTEFTFICTPLNEKGTKSPAYITPSYGICLNKNSAELDWGREFVNFILDEKNDKLYANDAAIIPNTKDAFSIAAEKYNLDAQTDISLCGQILFSGTYNGFTPIANSVKEVVKCSAQKYMVNLNKAEDGSIQYEKDEDGKEYLLLGNGTTKVYKEYVGEEDPTMTGYAFCTLDYYADIMEKQFAKYRQ